MATRRVKTITVMTVEECFVIFRVQGRARATYVTRHRVMTIITTETRYPSGVYYLGVRVGKTRSRFFTAD